MLRELLTSKETQSIAKRESCIRIDSNRNKKDD
jgi:hypothetical protein